MGSSKIASTRSHEGTATDGSSTTTTLPTRTIYRRTLTPVHRSLELERKRRRRGSLVTSSSSAWLARSMSRHDAYLCAGAHCALERINNGHATAFAAFSSPRWRFRLFISLLL